MRQRSWTVLVVAFGLLVGVGGAALASRTALVRADPGVL